MRVVTAQTQAQQHLTHLKTPIKIAGNHSPNALAKAAIARTFPSPPAPLPGPGRGEQNSKTVFVIDR